jgi:TetR/AcrR family transcriptional repressor of nem operon
MADVSEAISREATRCFTAEYAPLLSCLQEAQANGDLDPDRDLNQLTNLIRNCWLGALVIMKANKSEAPLREFHILLENMLQNAAA